MTFPMKVRHGIFLALGLLCGCTALVTEYRRSRNEPKLPLPERDRQTRISTRIMGQGRLTLTTMERALGQNNPQLSQEKIQEIARAYLEESRAEGVNHDLAFAQMSLETGYLRFRGQVRASQNNFCGLGATDDGAHGVSFRSVREGIRAHIQHLKAYGSREALKNPCVDPRFHFVSRGSARTLYDLAGRWASDRHYGEKLRERLILFYRLQNSES
ncbi:MAG: glucosaminidase domain-containing protein [Puniceicoccales bacterium]|jgi:hypothetical protein|nr:glucosaminidase domain-containing protein [Puniceicoccales bacterium]